MVRSAGTTVRKLRVALLCATALALLDASGASARIGVTSATNGDPLGRPPSESERILRIGIDVQANEVITTHANDRAHLVFLDGTSLTVGPNAQLVIDKFVYDPTTKTGELAVNASKGVLRLVGGKISKTNPITIRTPSSTIGIRGGITILDVQQSKTTSTFVFGNNMSVTGQGHTENITRPGSQVTTNSGSPPGPPVMAGQGSLNSEIGQLEGRGGGNQGSNQGGGNQGGGTGGPQGGGQNIASAADNGARNFGQGNSGQGPGGVSGPPGSNLGPHGNTNPGGNPQPNQVTNAVSGGQQQNLQNQGNQQNQGNSNSTSTSTSTKIIITHGRYMAEPTYSNFNSSNLSVTPNATNNQAIDPKITIATSITLKITVSSVGSVTLPWQTNTLTNGFSIGSSNLQSIASSLGLSNLRDGTGYVSANGEFFAYVFTTSSNTKFGFVGGTPTNTSGTSGFPTSGIGTFVLGNLGNSSRLPFADGTVGDNSDLSNAKIVSNLYAAYSSTLSATIGSAPPDGRATAMQATISISGTGSAQKSYMGVFIGTFLRDLNTSGGVTTTDNGQYMAGHFGATYRTSASDSIGRLVSAESTPSNGTGNGNAIYGTATGNGTTSTGDGAASGFILTPDKMTSTFTTSGGNVTDVTTTRTSQASFDQPYTSLSGSSYFNVEAGYKATTPSGIGQTRTSQTLNGFFGGLVDQLTSGGGTSTRAVTSTDPSSMTLTTNATTNRASAQMTASTWDTSTSATFNLGGTTGSNYSTSAFVDDNTYAIRDRTSEVGNTTTVGGSSTGVTSNTTIVSYNSAAIDTLFSNAGITKCTCSFLTWGWWGGDVAYGSTSAYNAGGRDRINLATYVAGTLATTTQLPNTGSATFTGHVVGNVLNGSNSYIAVGGYSNTWSWGSGSGSVTISNFDGGTYTGTTNLSAGTVRFSGSLSGPSSRAGSINGAFVQSGGAVAGQMGSFSVSGTNYKAAGTFAAQKQ